ncbi:MAG: formylglycine-generating enzyme family protein [Alphaproteobacteria bacterium]|nr:formylglycine-generating enzyme family protein [Alphaproteobacteria bacterium]
MLQVVLAAGTLIWAAAAQAQSSLPSGPFRDCTGCPVMVPIAPGAFTMGVPPGEEEREGTPDQFKGWSVPQHRVTIGRAFALGKYEVTRAEFRQFVSETGHNTGDKCWLFVENEAERKWEFQERNGSWRDPGFTQTDSDPVVCVSWGDAKAYVAWLSRKSGRTYRLPTEAEWEYAARAGSASARFWGDGREPACSYGNVRDLSMISAYNLGRDGDHYFRCSDGIANTAPVGQFQPNGFGLHDVLGNVWEWLEDCWNENYQGAPIDGTPWLTGDCSRRVGRGGSWINLPRFLRVGFRDWNGSGMRVTVTGFRVARTF